MMRIFDLLDGPQFTQFRKKQGQTVHGSKVVSKGGRQTDDRQRKTAKEKGETKL